MTVADSFSSLIQIIAIAGALVGLSALVTNDGPFTLAYAQTNPTGGQYCAEGDYKCHEDYAVQDYEAKNYTGAIYHYELAAENAPYGELQMGYEQAATALKYGNYTDYELDYAKANPSENNGSGSFPSDNISSSVLVFAYERGGGYAGPALSFERTSYDSVTKQLVSISALKSPEIRLLSEREQGSLMEAIENNGFFEAESEYPPEPGAADFFTYSLSVIMNGKTYRVTWTDASSNVPPGISTIVEAILNSTPT